MNVRLTKEQKIKIANSDDLYEIMQKVLMRENKLSRAQERFWIVGLANNNEIQFVELVALGGGNQVSVKAPEVFRMAIYKMATKIILVHNHPSGNLNASKSDIELTKKLIDAGRTVDIEVIDHLIISEESYSSIDVDAFDEGE